MKSAPVSKALMKMAVVQFSPKERLSEREGSTAKHISLLLISAGMEQKFLGQ
jgi:hypothetical protein